MNSSFEQYAVALMNELRNLTHAWLGVLRWRRQQQLLLQSTTSDDSVFRLNNNTLDMDALPTGFPVHFGPISETFAWMHEYPNAGEELHHVYTVELFFEGRTSTDDPHSSVAWKAVTTAGVLGTVLLGVFEIPAPIWEARRTALPFDLDVEDPDFVLEAVRSSLAAREPVRVTQRRVFTGNSGGGAVPYAEYHGEDDEAYAVAVSIFELRTARGRVIRELGRRRGHRIQESLRQAERWT